MRRIAPQQYIEFSTGDENYAVPISDVHEIIRMQEITEIPSGPYHVQGVTHLRGRVIPVISLRRWLGMPEAEPTKATRIVVVNRRSEYIGMIVDRVIKVTTFASIQTMHDGFGRTIRSSISCLGVNPNELVGILNVDKVLHEGQDWAPED
ncbi:chemotaxis protein CheW [Cohnella hongkongensis]|uniref:Chemotaxis protein CheW n=1 Tax=Cohnella hongkongensis TaxID=178337 RepID=A0ABV9FC03_9BACL